MKNIKSYAFQNNENGWVWWEKEYAESLQNEVFGENKKRNSSGSIYSDPDAGNKDYYEQICHFLNSQEREIFKNTERYYYYPADDFNGSIRIKVCENENGKEMFYLKTDQFGFSVPKVKNIPNPKELFPHPYSVYYDNELDKKRAVNKIVEWVYITRTIGGSFLWPEEEGYGQPPINLDRGGSKCPRRSSYINDRIDLTLLEIKHFYDIRKKTKKQEYNDFIGEYKKEKPEDVLCISLGKSPNLYKWLVHFDSFDTYIKYFKFDMFTSKNGGVIDITSEKGNCLEEVYDRKKIKKDFWNKKFDKVFDILCSKIKERTREIEKSIKREGT